MLTKIEPGTGSKKKNFSKYENKEYNPRYKNKQKYRSSKKKSELPTSGQIICFKCGRPGHKANKCNFKKKVNEIFADDENLRNKFLDLYNIREDQTDVSDSEESADTDFSGEGEINE